MLTAFGYGYDQAGNRQYKAFADGAKESYGYDGLNRLTSAEYPGGRRVDYGYDAVGNRLSMSDSTGTGTRWATTASAASQYYPASLAIGPPDAGAGCSNDHSWWPWYSSSATSSMLAVGYARAERARGLRVHETVAGGFVTRIDLVDDKGLSHTVHEGGDGTACGGWLTLKFPLTDYKVAQAKVYTAAVGQIGIDAVGLDVVATQTYEYNGFNQLTSVASSDGSAATTFGYDGNGNQVRKADASGLTQCVYNQDNRLVGIALANGGSNAFEYDANGLRTKKTDSSGTTRYLLDGLSVIAQYAPDGTKQAWYTQSLARIDEVLSVVNGQGKYWYQADALGSTYALADNAGNVTALGGYDVFGAPVAMGGQTVGQPFGFTGREHELDSGLTYHRDRYMQAAFGRWTQADRLAAQLHASDAAASVASGMPTEAWRFTAALGRQLAGTSRTHPYSYGARPTVETDPTGFFNWNHDGKLSCEKEDWIGLPLVFGELSLKGIAAGIVFGGVYWGSSGDAIAVIALYGEFGFFGDLDKGFFSSGFEAGVGFGFENDLSARDFDDAEGGGWELEWVFAAGPLVTVFSRTGQSAFFTPSPSIGLAAIGGTKHLQWAWPVGTFDNSFLR